MLRGVAGYYLLVALFERFAPRRYVRAYQRLNNRLQLPLMGVLPGWGVIETVGRKTGQLRRTPVGGRVVDGSFWIVAGDAPYSAFVKNIEANGRVRVRFLGRWHRGTARVVVDDDPVRRVLVANPVNGLFVLLANRRSGLLSIRIDLEDS